MPNDSSLGDFAHGISRGRECWSRSLIRFQHLWTIFQPESAVLSRLTDLSGASTTNSMYTCLLRATQILFYMSLRTRLAKETAITLLICSYVPASSLAIQRTRGCHELSSAESPRKPRQFMCRCPHAQPKPPPPLSTPNRRDEIAVMKASSTAKCALQSLCEHERFHLSPLLASH